METLLSPFLFLSMIVVFSVDAQRKRREFLKKHTTA